MNTLEIPESTGFAYRINDDGQAVGHVFGYGTIKWDSNRTATKLSDPPGCQVLTMDFNSIHINSAGAVAGSGLILQDSNSKNAVILWQPSGEAQVIRTTDYPDVSNLLVYGITDSGKVIFRQQCASTGEYSIIIYNSDGTFTDGTPSGGLDTFNAQNPNCNNYGLVVGQKTIDGKTRAVVIDTSAKTLRVLPMLPESNDTTDASYATAANNQGIVVGCCSVNGHALWVIWDALGNIHNLGLPPSFNGGFTTGINDDGMVIGTAGKESGSSAFIRLSDGRWINLGLYEGISASYPYGLNNLGQVVGVSDPPNASGARISRPVIWNPINY
jgi:hypothetical protein